MNNSEEKMTLPDTQRLSADKNRERIEADGYRNQSVSSEEKKCCPDPRGNELCTNGKDTYHEWNMREGSGCTFCGEKLHHSTPVREWGNFGSPERRELSRVLEAYRLNPSNGNRHEQAAVDFVKGTIFSLLERLEEEVGKLKEPEQNDNKYSTINPLNLAQNKKLNDVLDIITHFKKEI